MEFKIILLIDDDEDDRALFMEAVEDIDHGLRGITADNVSEALKILQSAAELPSLILLDFHAGSSNGIENMSLLKANTAYSNIPVAIYSSYISEEQIAIAFEHGAFHYIKKPSSYEGIIAAIKSALTMTVAT